MKGFFRTIAITITVALFAASGGSSESSQSSGIYAEKIPAILALVANAMEQEKLNAVLLGITVEGEELLTLADGESMTGVPTTANMHLRNGSVAVAYMGSLLYRLVDAGIVKAGDAVGKWLPDLPESQNVTLEMLINGTSGYPDYVPMDAFLEKFYANPFYQWSPEELIALGLSEAPRFAPGRDWNYAHTNFVILGLALEKAAGRSFGELMQEYILTPFGMTQTEAPDTPSIPQPVLHSYTDERGPYEDATFWNPSWTLARGAVQTSTIRDTLIGFRAVGRGQGLTPASYQAMLAPHTAGMKFWTPKFYYAQGIVFDHGWLTQAPSFGGLFGTAGYFMDKDIAVAVWCTKSIESKTEGNTASVIFKQLTAILTPESPAK
ncbi:beta-lactamase [delta proteobacterium NaphS2]|nr:beta-lactamase [delta proteobacterium NaphS2]